MATFIPGKASRAGEMVAMKVVLQLPPRLSARKRVRRESRYGTCEREPLPRSPVRAEMTLPRALREAFIRLLSSNRAPEGEGELKSTLP